MGAIMMALQKSLLEQSDIVPTLKSFVFEVYETDEDKKLTIKNPPSFKIDGDVFNPEPQHPRASGSD